MQRTMFLILTVLVVLNATTVVQAFCLTSSVPSGLCPLSLLFPRSYVPMSSISPLLYYIMSPLVIHSP
jgi:hypothetical protein